MSMSIRSLTKQTLIYGVGTILARFVTFLLLPLYTNILSPEDYGLTSLVFAFLGFMNIIYNYGLDSAMMRFYSDDSNTKDKDIIFSTSVFLSILTSLIFTMLILFSCRYLSGMLLSSKEYSVLIKYAAFILLFDCLAHLPYALLRLKEKALLFMSIRIANVVIVFTLNIYLVAMLRKGVEGIFLSNLVTSVVTTIILYLLILREIKPLFSFMHVKQLILFGLPFVPAGLASVTMEMLNRYIISHMLDLKAVGIFSAGFKLGIFMLLLTTAFYYAWQPFFLKAGKKESSKVLFSKVFNYFVLVAMSTWLILTIFIKEIVNFHIGNIYLVGKEYQSCISIVPYILLGYVFYGINIVFLPGIYFEKKTKFIAINTLISAAINVAFNFILIPYLGIVGSAIASLIGYVTLAILTFFTSQRCFKINYNFRRVFVTLLISIVIGYILFVTQPSSIIKILSIIVYAMLLIIFGSIKKEEINSIISAFKKYL